MDRLDGFPRAGNPLQSIFGGDGGQGLYIYYGDIFVAVLNPSGTSLLYSSYFGGNRDDEAYGLALDSSGNVYVAGNSMSTNLATHPMPSKRVLRVAPEGEGGIIYGDALYIKFSASCRTSIHCRSRQRRELRAGDCSQHVGRDPRIESCARYSLLAGSRFR